MPKYRYDIQLASGEVRTGIVEADSLMSASDWARGQGAFLINIAPASADGLATWLTRLRRLRVEPRPGLRDVLDFTKQLAVMTKAGISVRDAVESIAEQVENTRFRRILMQIRSDLESGQPFSAALAKHRKVFSPLYVDMIRASELSGKFVHVLRRLQEYLTEQLEAIRMVRGAMMYPAILMLMCVLAVAFMLVFVLPKFTVIFTGKEHLLPVPTKMLMHLSGFLKHYWYVPIVCALGVSMAISYALRTPVGKVVLDKLKLKAPLFKGMFRSLAITRSLRAMGELINAGVPLMDTLEATAKIAGNHLYERLWLRVRDAVKGGSKIVHPLSGDALLPKSVVRMIAAGEESGALGEVLADVSEYYAKELKDTIKAASGMIEPLMIVIMGVVVGFIAMSIMLPVFKMSSILK